jgi:uncharacterized protein DUF6599
LVCVFMKVLRPILGSILLFVASLSFAADSVTAPLLPKQFGGWQIAGSVQTSKEPSQADSVNSALLKEYGFTDFAAATYTRDDGRKVRLKAARFADTSGAYGAFTFYKMPQMVSEKIGDQGAALNERVLFYRGNILVDADFGKLTAMSAAELRELASLLPLPGGNTRNLPGLPAYLPNQSYVKNSAKYIVGGIGLEKTNALLPAQLVDFTAGAEVVLGNYNSSGGLATLMLISYPTPQIAAESLRRIDAATQLGTAPKPDGAVPLDAGHIFTKRTGPIVVVAAGPLSSSEATALLASVNYDADVTWNENTSFSKKDNLANLLVNIILLCGILMGLALVAGIAFGGIRIMVKRIMPQRVFDRPEGMEFISLHLSDHGAQRQDSKVSSSIKAS